jgi:glycosyltransferase involved in cell wall biosynthesis
MKIILIGLPYFAKNIAENLKEIDRSNAYNAIEPCTGVLQKLIYFWSIITADVIYQIGGSHVTGGALRLAMSLNKKIIMHWVGTDVLNLTAAFRKGEVDAELIKRSTHLCEVDWMQKELARVNIFADIVQIACFGKEIQLPSKFPDYFSILTYVGKGREIFYGIDKFITLARLFPEIEIRIAGISTYSEALPANIRLLGWVDDMEEEYRNCVLYLRLPEHDGLAFSVLEAMASGRYVGYINEFFGTQKIENEAELVKFVKLLLSKFNMNNLKINQSGYDFVVNNYSKNKVINRLVKIMLN